MAAAPLPTNETARQRALDELAVLDTAPEPELDALCEAASFICGTPISLIGLIDHDRQWFKASIGLAGATETSREHAFCAHVVARPTDSDEDSILEVCDARFDPRFSDNPFVTGAPNIRFYAGAPLTLTDGFAVGTLCVIDRAPRQLDERQRRLLRHLARAASSILQAHRNAREQRTLLAKVAASEQRVQRLYEATPAMLHLIDASGKLIGVSDRWLATLGYAREEVLGREATDFLTDASRQVARRMIPHLIADGRIDRLAYQMVTKTGAIVDVELSAILERDRSGNPLNGTAILENVGERLRAEHALREERERLGNLIEATRVGTWEWNIATGAVRINAHWARMLGYEPEEIAPLTIERASGFMHQEDASRARQELAKHHCGTTESFECEARMRHRNGSWVWVLSRGKILTRTDTGRPEWMFGIHLDITDQKRQEEKLRRNQDLLDRTGRMAGVGGWEVDLPTGQVAWSDETCRIHGVEPGFLPSLTDAYAFYAPEARPVIEAAVRQCIAHGTTWDLELPLIRADGRRIWVRAVGASERQEGKAVRLSGAFQDVTADVLARRHLQDAHDRIALATGSGRIGVWDFNVETRTIEWNPLMYALHGLDPDRAQPSYELWMSRVLPEDRARTEAAIRETLDGRKPFDTEFRIVRPGGEIRSMRSTAKVTRNGRGKALRMIGVNWDITESRRLQQDLAEQHELLEVTLASIGDGVITTDPQGKVKWLNPAASKLTGWQSNDANGLSLNQVFRVHVSSTREVSRDPAGDPLPVHAAPPASDQAVLVSRDGQEFGIEHTAAPIRNAQGETLGTVLVFRDVTEQRRLTGEMIYRAMHDPLTGLLNRIEFDNRLGRILQDAKTNDAEHTLLFLDLDQFKVVNDSCGHAVGDQLLQQISKLLRGAIGTNDILARLGGDEFAIIVADCPTERAQLLAQNICDRIDDFRFAHEGRRFRIGVSIGLAPIDSRWKDGEAILRAADASCYSAKEAGRHRFHAWRDSDRSIQARHGETQWAARIEQALDENRFELYFQHIEPIQPALREQHAEILVRMRDPDHGLVLPGAFLRAAERFHLTSRLDRWVLNHAVRWMRSAPVKASLPTLWINLSGQSVGDRAFHRDAIELLSPLPAALLTKICFEVTETEAVTCLADAAGFFDRIRQFGIRIALDDFGAGASSFNYLKSLPIDFIKIDGQFIKNVRDDRLDRAAVRCFIEVAQVLGVRTVAEHVENGAVLGELRLLGVDFAQGYLFHRPAPLATALTRVPVRAAERALIEL